MSKNQPKNGLPVTSDGGVSTQKQHYHGLQVFAREYSPPIKAGWDSDEGRIGRVNR